MTPQEKVNKLDINKIVEKYLNYTFADIDWQYDNLTTVEKAIMSKEEFKLLKEVYHSDAEIDAIHRDAAARRAANVKREQAAKLAQYERLKAEFEPKTNQQ